MTPEAQSLAEGEYGGHNKCGNLSFCLSSAFDLI